MNSPSRTARLAAAFAAVAITMGIVFGMTGLARNAYAVEVAKATGEQPVLLAAAKAAARTAAR